MGISWCWAKQLASRWPIAIRPTGAYPFGDHHGMSKPIGDVDRSGCDLGEHDATRCGVAIVTVLVFGECVTARAFDAGNATIVGESHAFAGIPLPLKTYSGAVENRAGSRAKKVGITAETASRLMGLPIGSFVSNCCQTAELVEVGQGGDVPRDVSRGCGPDESTAGAAGGKDLTGGFVVDQREADLS